MRTSKEGDTPTPQKRTPRENGQAPSEEYTRFETLMRRLVRTPKRASEPKRS
jgi:hypothetical protein